jgi:hypothetical protein
VITRFGILVLAAVGFALAAAFVDFPKVRLMAAVVLGSGF